MSRKVVEINGKPEWIRTIDLFRVNLQPNDEIAT
jgi:hypothetical protein